MKIKKKKKNRSFCTFTRHTEDGRLILNCNFPRVSDGSPAAEEYFSSSRVAAGPGLIILMRRRDITAVNLSKNLIRRTYRNIAVMTIIIIIIIFVAVVGKVSEIKYLNTCPRRIPFRRNAAVWTFLINVAYNLLHSSKTLCSDRKTTRWPSLLNAPGVSIIRFRRNIVIIAKQHAP